MGLGLAWREGLRFGARARGTLAVLGLAGLAIDTMEAAHQAIDWITPTDLLRVAGWGLPAAMLVAAAAFARGQTAVPRALAGTVALGDASYALYLVHPFVVGTLMRLWTGSGVATKLGYWPFVALSVALSIAAAFACHIWFEVPVARRLALRRLDGKRVLGLADPPAVS